MHTNVNKKKSSFLFVLIVSAFSLSIVKTAHSSSQESEQRRWLAKFTLATLLPLAGNITYVLIQENRLKLLLKKLMTDFKNRFLRSPNTAMNLFIELTNPIEQFQYTHWIRRHRSIPIDHPWIDIIGKIFGSEFLKFLDKWRKKLKKFTYDEAYWFMKNSFFYPMHSEAIFFIDKLDIAKRYAMQVAIDLAIAQKNQQPLNYEYNYFRRIGFLEGLRIFEL